MAKKIDSGENLKRISKFLLDFADALMISGTQTSRIVRNVQRLSELFGCEANLIMLPKTIIKLWRGCHIGQKDIAGQPEFYEAIGIEDFVVGSFEQRIFPPRM